jgi:rubrerythrin
MVPNELGSTNSLIDILETGIKREEEANEFYLEAAGRVISPRQKKILLQLAREERGHKANLLKLLTAAKAQKEIDRAISGDTTDTE